MPRATTAPSSGLSSVSSAIASCQRAIRETSSWRAGRIWMASPAFFESGVEVLLMSVSVSSAEFTRQRIAAQAQRLRRVLAMAAAVLQRGLQQHLVEACAQSRVQFGVTARERG